MAVRKLSVKILTSENVYFSYSHIVCRKIHYHFMHPPSATKRREHLSKFHA